MKDCECITHEGPHWLHMDQLWHEKNHKLLMSGNTAGFLQEEIARLKDKARHLSEPTPPPDRGDTADLPCAHDRTHPHAGQKSGG